MDIEYTPDKATWLYQGQTINVDLKDIIWGSYRRNQNLVVLEIGEGFKTNEYHYYTVDGEFLASYNQKTGKVIWHYQGEHSLEYPSTKNIGFYPKNNLILLIYKKTEGNESVVAMKIFDLDGNLLQSLDSPEGYSILYVNAIEGQSARIVCEAAIEENVDSYGRDRFNFTLDLQNGEWSKGNLAY